MNKADSNLLVDLIKRTKKEGVEISLTGTQLSLKFSRGKNVGKDLIEELKTNKSSLIEYLKRHPDGMKLKAIEPAEPSLSYKGEDYYDITSTQRYWVDSQKNKTFKAQEPSHGTIILGYRVLGNLDIQTFNKAILYLITRHESLRSTFYEIDGNHFLKVEKEYSKYIPQFKDSRSTLEKEAGIQQYKEFLDHQFKFDKPLFLTRLVQIDESEYMIFFKVHHVIFDALSRPNLLNDLISAYVSINKGIQPEVELLKYQYKDYLCYDSNYVRKNYARHKKHWMDKFGGLPKELNIRAAMGEKLVAQNKISKIEQLTFPANIESELFKLSNNLSTTLFVVLQASFKSFLYNITGQHDIVIGTYVFGRDHPGSHNQIGCYAKTVLIRSVLTADDSFIDIIKKVREANEDMWNYRACPLMEVLEGMLAPGERITGSFWKVNMHYSKVDQTRPQPSGNSRDEDPTHLRLEPLPTGSDTHMEIDMELHFHSLPEELVLELRYNSGAFDTSSIKVLLSEYLSYLKEALNCQ